MSDLTSQSSSYESACPNGNDCPISEEINGLKKEVTELKNLVRTDHLTGLFNKRHLNDALEQEVERTLRSQQPTTFILLDIDHFKSFNDTYGHIAGDYVLSHLAKILKNAVRKIDIPCRYGGEEFAIILPSTPLLVGIQVAERIRKAIEENPLNHDGQLLNITASLGVDAYFYHSKDAMASFIERVDKQLYKAKESGRNQVSHAIYKMESAAQVSDDEKDALFNVLDDSN